MSVMAEQVDRAITDYGACAGCSVNGWITWHLGPCPQLVGQSRAAHPSTFANEHRPQGPSAGGGNGSTASTHQETT